MDYAVTAQQMKAIDQNTIHRIGIPSMVLYGTGSTRRGRSRRAYGRRTESWKEGPDPGCAVPETTGQMVLPRDVSCKGRGYETVLLFAGNPEHDSKR